MIYPLAADFPWYLFFTAMAFAWGACFGSYLNVCVYRIPLDISTATPPSHCPACKTPIKWYHNVPIFAWLALRGRCASCHQKFSARYMIVELLTAILFTLVWFKLDWYGGPQLLGLTPMALGDWLLVPIYWLMIFGLLLGTFVDFDHMIIPDRVSIGGIIIGLILSGACPALHAAPTHLAGLIEGAIGAAAGFGLLYSVGVIGKLIFRKDAMGFGDVKLLGAIGAFLGWEAILFTVIISSFIGSIVGITLVVMRKSEMQGKIPFGPYLSLAALLWLFWGQQWWGLYLDYLLGSPRPM